MKENNKNERMDDKLWMKSMMESARKEPSENLSHRIMHQIETEQALTRAKPKISKQTVSSSLLNLRIFGLMYFVLLITGGYFYLQGGKDALLTDTFLWTCITISSIFSFFFLITTIDNSLRRKAKNKPSASE
ncbi:MAG TPA: hypothetical protein VLY84_09275 [Dysgonamonadaceae bacterium]|jgi:hypothetical protein|nr:hypothetical protein [Dysgonamonadaceae bacterium]